MFPVNGSNNGYSSASGSSPLFTYSRTELTNQLTLSLVCNISARTTKKTQLFHCCNVKNLLPNNGNVFTEPLPKNGCLVATGLYATLQYNAMKFGKNVKLLLNQRATPFRRITGFLVKLHAFYTSALDNKTIITPRLLHFWDRNVWCQCITYWTGPWVCLDSKVKLSL
jgi:hypothetical protein